MDLFLKKSSLFFKGKQIKLNNKFFFKYFYFILKFLSKGIYNFQYRLQIAKIFLSLFKNKN